MEKILRYASLFYALLVFVGYINLHAYYSAFGIEIWAYLGAGELLMSFLPLSWTLLKIAGICLVLYLFGVWILPVTNGSPWELATSALTALHKRFMKPARKVDDLGSVVVVMTNQKKHRWAMVLMVVLMITAKMGYAKWLMAIDTGIAFPYPIWFTWVVKTVGVIAAVVIAVSVCDLIGSHGALTLAIVLLGVQGLLLQIADRRIEAKHVIAGSANKRFKLMVGDSTISDGKRFGYVGQSNAAVFLYDRSDSLCLALPMDELEAIWIEHVNIFEELRPRFPEGVPPPRRR